MARKFKVEKAHCELHKVDFKKLIQVRVSCPRYQQCLEEAIARHEANIAEAKREAEKKGKQWAVAKAVLQMVCPYEEPPHAIPEFFQVKKINSRKP
jgi:hypothetical protein